MNMINDTDQTPREWGPFTKDTFDKQRWERIRENIYTLNSANEDDILPDVQLFLRFLVDLNACPDYNKYFGDPSIKEYFYDRVFRANAWHLIASRFFRNPDLLETSNACLTEVIFFWVKTLDDEDVLNLLDMACLILDPTRYYYKANNQEDVPDTVIPGFLMESPKEHLDWIQSLKEGDLIDCIKQDPIYKKMCWSHARVLAITDSEVKIAYLNEHDDNNKNLDKKMNANELALYRTKCFDFEWRLSLKVEDELDVYDSSRVWVNSAILDVREIPLADGTFIREFLIRGLPSRYHEWISSTNPRISNSNNEDVVIEDSNDRVYTQEGKNLYAVTRLGHCRSKFLVKLVNQFGELGGFEKIYKRIANTKKPASIHIVKTLALIIRNLSPILHRDFALSYIPKLQEAIWENILGSNVEEFSKESIDDIVDAVDSLLKRVYSLPENQEIIKKCTLQVCCKCLHSGALKFKLQGLEILLKVLSEGIHQARFITYLKDFITENSIVGAIFGSELDTQLIKNSVEVIRFMLDEFILDQEDFQIIWDATERDRENRLAIYDLLKDVSMSLKSSHLEYIVVSLAKISPQNLTTEDTLLVEELCGSIVENKAFFRKSSEFYWQIISDTTGCYAWNINKSALKGLCKIMAMDGFQEERMNVLNNCVINIKRDIAVLNSLTILTSLIKQYPDYSKSTCIDKLCKEKKLVGLIIESVKSLKACIKIKTDPYKAELTEEVLNTLVGERSSYLAHIEKRMEFLHYIITNSSPGEILFDCELLNELWEVTISNVLVPSEINVVSKWIQAIVEFNDGFPISINELKKFCCERTDMSKKEEFTCFKHIFFNLNKKLNKMFKVLNSCLLDEENEDKQKKAFDYILNVLPYELEEIDKIWNLIFTLKHDDIAEQAMEFLKDLYINVSVEREPQNEQIRRQYLDNCYQRLKETINDRNNLSDDEFNIKCIRCLQLISLLMDESEKKGIADLKPHSCLVKEEPWVLTVKNEVNDDSHIPRKIEVEVSSNTLVVDLCVKIAQKFKVAWDQIELIKCRDQKEIKEIENSRPIRDLSLMNNEVLIARERWTPPIPRTPLILPDDTLNPIAQKIFVKWFEEYSENSRMSPEDLARFFHSWRKSYYSPNDLKVKEIFQMFDENRNNYLTEDNFLELYHVWCKQSPNFVWKNLESHYYRNDLREITELEKVDIKSLPAYIVSTNNQYFELIFSMLEFRDTIADKAWDILKRLPTNQKLFTEIASLKMTGASGSTLDWSLLLNLQYKYKFLYVLYVIECLLENNKSCSDDFVSLGGLNYVVEMLKTLVSQDYSGLKDADKEALSLLIKIINRCLCLGTGNDISRKLSAIQKSHLSLNSVQRYLDLQDKNCEKYQVDENEKCVPLSTMDFKDLLKILPLLSCKIISSKNNLEARDVCILEHSLSNFVAILLSNKDYALSLFSPEKNNENSCIIAKYLIEGIFCSKIEFLSRSFLHAIYVLCRYFHGDFVSKYFIELLLDYLPSSRNNEKKEYSLYFELVCKLIKDTYANDIPSENLKNRLDKVNQRLMGHTSKEISINLSLTDELLSGFLSLSETISSKTSMNSTQLVQEIFNKYLFNFQEYDSDLFSFLESKKSVKCMSQKSRSASYKLLATLCKTHEVNLISLLTCMKNLAAQINNEKDLRNGLSSETSETRSSLGYIGIKNLGCVNYMTVILQQFFMIPTFRYAILAVDDKKQPNWIQTGKFMVDDNILHQLQRMFGFLEFSDRRDYNPQEFCYTFKDFSGQPVNVTVQQDPQEFLNMIFDKLEHALRQTPFQYLIEGVYGGKMLTQVICSSCGAKKEREDAFYNLAVPVNGLKTLQESLEKFISGETIEDYFCHACKKKNDVIKRTILSELPNVLFIPLQRVIFNLDTLQNEKINSRLEFPSVLNLGPYTQEGLECRGNFKDAEFKLTGIIMHTGSAGLGHDYCYMNTNRGKVCKGDQWLEFNDSIIRPFDTNRIKKECFGGLDANGRESSTNAQMLIYERASKTPLKLVVRTPQDKHDLQKIFKGECTITEMETAIRIEKGENKQEIEHYYYDFYQFQRFIPLNMQTDVWEDNRKFLLERHLDTEEFFQFIEEVCKNAVFSHEYNKQDIESLIETLGALLFHFLPRKEHKNKFFSMVVENLKHFFSLNADTAWIMFNHYIRKDIQYTLSLLLNCREKQIRSGIAQIILSTINTLISQYGLSLNCLNPTIIEDTTTEEQHHRKNVEKTILTFLDTLINSMSTEVAKNWFRLESFFEFWCGFCVSGQSQMNYIFQKDFITVLIDFYLGGDSPVPEFSEKKYTMGNRYVEPDFKSLIQIIAHMIKNKPKICQPTTDERHSIYELSSNAITCLLCPKFYQKALDNKDSSESVGQIIQHVSFEDKTFSQTLANILLNGLNKSSVYDVNSYLDATGYFITLDDMFQIRRVQWILGSPQASMMDLDDNHNSAEDVVMNYKAPIFAGDSQSFLNLILNNMKRPNNLQMSLLRKLLLAMNESPVILNYVTSLPPPKSDYSKFTDWIPVFLDLFLAQARKDTSLSREIGLEAKKYWKSIEKTIL